MGCIAGSLLFVEEYEEGLRVVGFENVSNTSKGIYFLGRLRDALLACGYCSSGVRRGPLPFIMYASSRPAGSKWKAITGFSAGLKHAFRRQEPLTGHGYSAAGRRCTLGMLATQV